MQPFHFYFKLIIYGAKTLVNYTFNVIYNCKKSTAVNQHYTNVKSVKQLYNQAKYRIRNICKILRIKIQNNKAKFIDIIILCKVD